MNINSINKTVSNIAGEKPYKKEMSNFKNKLDAIINNDSKLDTYIQENMENELDSSITYSKADSTIPILNMNSKSKTLNINEDNQDNSNLGVSSSVSKETADEITEKLGNKEFWNKIFEDLEKDDINSLKKSDKAKTNTDSEIVVKADGSRVLVITTSMGGMEETMSLELSKPTETLVDDQGRNHGLNKAEESSADNISSDDSLSNETEGMINNIADIASRA